MNQAQEAKLRTLCTRYSVPFIEEHYLTFEADSCMMPAWTEGWIGGKPGTIYVGVSPEGEAHS